MQQNGKEIHPLKKARLKLGYTQAMLADFVQVGEATIQRAENGNRYDQILFSISVTTSANSMNDL